MNQINVGALSDPSQQVDTRNALTTIVTAIGPTFLWALLIFTCILIFRKSIKAFLARATHIEAFGAKIFSQTAGQLEGRSILEGAVNNFRQNSVARSYSYTLNLVPFSVYFFSHDLMLSYAGLISGARPEIVLFTLQSAMNHLSPLGLTDSPVDESLRIVASKLREVKDDLTENERSDLALRLWVVSRFVGDTLLARVPK